MNNSLKLVCINRCKRNIFSVIVFLFCMFAAAPAFGQYVYTDTWADEHDIYGCGVSDDDYSFPQHQFAVTLTLTRPDGSNLIAGGGFEFHHVRVDLQTPFDDVHFGEYNFSSEHSEWCPYVEPFVSGFTSAITITGVSVIGYYLDRHIPPESTVDGIGRCEYKPVQLCNVRCVDPSHIKVGVANAGDCPIYRTVRKKWKETKDCGCGSLLCFFLSATDETTQQCYELSGVP